MVRWVTLCAAFALVAPAALAERSELERQAAEAFGRATRYFDAEDYLNAAESFELANRLVPSASVHYNIARSYELAELPDIAAQHYRAFLDARAGNPQRRRQVEQRLAALTDGLGWVRVSTEPSGATISVDGRERGVSPILLALTEGSHEIVASGDGLEARRTVEAGASELQVTLALEAPEPEPVVEESATADGEDDEAATSSSSSRVPPPDQPWNRLHHGFFWAGLALSIGSGVALAVVGSSLLDKLDEYNSLSVTDPRNAEVAAEGQRLEAATTALWVTTGIFLGATIIFAIFTNWRALRRHRDAEGRRGAARFALDELVSGVFF